MNLKWLLFAFTGRIGRQTYWLCTLGFFVLFFLLGAIVDPEGGTGGVLSLLVMILITYMGLAVAAKRWHDRDKSGWWSLVALIPLVGPIWMLVENGFLPGTRGPNRFGPDPIGSSAPIPVVHEGQTYYRQPNGSFTDALGNPVMNAALLGALGAAYLATRPGTTDSWSNTYSDQPSSSSNATETSAGAAQENSSSGGSWWSSGSSNSGSGDGWGGGGDSGGGGGD